MSGASSTAEPGSHGVVVMLTHGIDQPSFALHALRMAGSATALGESVGLYLAVNGTTLLAADAPEALAAGLSEVRELGVSVYACPSSLNEHAIPLAADACQALGAAAALEVMRRAHTVVSL